MPPNEPVDIPAEAYSALASLRAALEGLLPEGTEFGIGIKRTGGEFLESLALVVYLRNKLPEEEVPADQLIPPIWQFGDIQFATDVVQSNPTPIQLVNDTSSHAPLLGGIEIGWSEALGDHLVRVHRGTIGCVVQRRSDGARVLLTAAHVTPPDVPIWQAAPGEAGAALIGMTERTDSTLDCAIVGTNGHGGNPLTEILEVGPVRGAAAFELWGPAKKRGRTTGFTSGVVVSVVLSPSGSSVDRLVVATFPFGGLFAYHGDSGSAVLNGRDEVIGLLVEMDEDVYVDGHPVTSVGRAVPIHPVLDALEVEIAVSPPIVTRVEPNTAFGVLANGGWTEVAGAGFDAGSRVTFGGVPALSVTPASPHSLIVIPPIQFGVTVDVVVETSLGERSAPNPGAVFSY